VTLDTRARLKTGWYLLGPAFVAAIAYVDPGNVAANISAGAQFGFALLWVIVLANVMAGLVQYLSAKLGLVTGRSLPESIGAKLNRPARLAFWLQAEIVAMATDVAEVIGGAIALHILFGLPLLLGGIITGAVSLLLLRVQDQRGQRIFERVITGLLLVIAIGFTASFFVATPPPGDVLGGLVPRFLGNESVLLAAAILGATVMPHAVYLHSGLARDRHGHPEPGPQRRRLLRITRLDVGLAMVVAGAVNVAMLLVAALNMRGRGDISSIEMAYAAVHDTVSPMIATLFAIGLLASGLASASVGAYAGAMIMQGLLHRSVPMLLRRLVTLAPAVVILAVGFDPTRTLVLSQVVLSFGIPFALIPLVRLTSDRAVMGADTNHRVTTGVGWVIGTLISLLNVVLIFLTVRANG
jgi:manganese transport protein